MPADLVRIIKCLIFSKENSCRYEMNTAVNSWVWMWLARWARETSRSSSTSSWSNVVFLSLSGQTTVLNSLPKRRKNGLVSEDLKPCSSHLEVHGRTPIAEVLTPWSGPTKRSQSFIDGMSWSWVIILCWENFLLRPAQFPRISLIVKRKNREMSGRLSQKQDSIVAKWSSLSVESQKTSCEIAY